MPEAPNPSIRDVRGYWNASPLFSHERSDVGSPEFFAAIDETKRTDSERFAMDYWAFDKYASKRVLDIGCGPGWVSVQFAKGGANVTAVDLTTRAIELTEKHLSLFGLRASLCEASAECLPFPDNTFDLIVASGVLHHTPRVDAALREACRVTAPHCEGKITLYRKGILHARIAFIFVRFVMRLLGVRHPGSDLGRDALSVNDFIRRYDGDRNPIGIGKTDAEWASDLRAAGWTVTGWRIHFFPKRFLPFARFVPALVHRWLDRAFGTMAYFHLRKPG